MKKLLFGALVGIASLSASAQDYKYMNVETTSAAQAIELATVEKITFTDTHAIVITTLGDYAFPLGELTLMDFASTPSAVDELPVQTQGLRVYRGQLIASGQGLLRIYNTSGVLVQVARINQPNATLSLDKLPSGTYVATMGKQSIKMNK